MKCEEKIGEYCRPAITYKKYAQVRRCSKCCLTCKERCYNICDQALGGLENEYKETTNNK